MSGVYKAVAAALVLLAGLGIVVNSTALSKTVEESFSESYPGSDDIWSDQGTLTNLTTTASGDLEIASGSANGTFKSDMVMYDNFEVLQVITDMEDIDKKNSVKLELSIYDDQNALIFSDTFDLQNGRNSVDTIDFQNQTAQSFDYTLKMSRDSSSDTTPVSTEVLIDGTNERNVDSEILDTTVIGIAAVVGAVIVLFAGS